MKPTSTPALVTTARGRHVHIRATHNQTLCGHIFTGFSNLAPSLCFNCHQAANRHDIDIEALVNA